MGIGPSALPPPAYVDFCKRQPLDCGPDPQDVVAGARRAEADRAALLASVAPGRRRGLVLPALLPIRPEPRAPDAAASGGAWPALTPRLWARLNDVNAKVNRALLQQTDERTYGVRDYWATPLERGGRYGDCEDYVLEKEHALVAAGVPRRALNIALVTTPSATATPCRS